MRNQFQLFALLLLVFIQTKSYSQVDENQLGGWYMYFFNGKFKNSSWGIQGDVQYRNWNIMGDLEQLLLRAGITYKPKNTSILFTVGYGNITTGTYGTDNSTFLENRIYQEVLYPVKIGSRFYLAHRFRYEQRFVEDQDFRTRFRFNLFAIVPFNMPELDKKAIYLALYNELFINGERDIGDGKRVELFDRNRAYAALGYAIRKQLRIQFGIMRQVTDTWGKNQLQLSLHHNF